MKGVSIRLFAGRWKEALSALWCVWMLASSELEAMYPFYQDVMSRPVYPAAIRSSGSALYSSDDLACGLDRTCSPLFRVQTERHCISLQNTVKVSPHSPLWLCAKEINCVWFMKEVHRSIQNVVCFKQFNAILLNFVNFLPLSSVDVTPK